MDTKNTANRAMALLAQMVDAIRLSIRRLFRVPLFSFAVICSIAICVGPNAATFSALYALALKALPFQDSQQLVTVFNVAERSGGQLVLSSTTQYNDFKEHADLFSDFATSRQESGTIEEGGAPFRVEVQRVSAGFFDLLRVKPAVGRFFVPNEETIGKDQALVLSDRFWRAHFRGDPAVVGEKIIFGGQVFQIVGIAPRSLESLFRNVGFFQPYAAPASKFDPQTRYRGDIALYGRLKKGITLEAGRAQLLTLEDNFLRGGAGPALKALVAAAGYRLALEPLRPGGAVSPSKTLWLLQGGALFVLLIGCMNAMNLFLARMNNKHSEMAIRVALGAGPWVLLLDLLAETFLLTFLAVLLGIGGAYAALHVFNHYLPVLVNGAPPVTIDSTVLLVSIAAACIIAVAVGVVPLIIVYRSALNHGETRTSTGVWARRVSSALVISQVAFAVVLLVGSALLMRSFVNVTTNDPGYDADHIVCANITLPNSYRNAPARINTQNRVLEALRSIPGVRNAAASLRAVLGNDRPVPFARRGEPVDSDSQLLIHIVAVSPSFFDTMGMSVQSGRGFNERDEFSKAPVAVVDKAFADRYYPGRLVEGEEIYLNWGLPLSVDAWPRIVGVVSRANLTGLDSQDKLPVVYVPTVGYPARGFDILVASPRATSDLMRDIRTKLAEIDPAMQLVGEGSLGDKLASLLLPRRGVTLLVGLFSVLALVLAAIGLYSVLSYDISQRTREIGIRSAIGASRWQIVKMVILDGLMKTGIGMFVGTIGAFFLAQFLGSFLFEVGKTDLVAHGFVIVVLGIVSFFACLLPAMRAAQVDPIVALQTN